MRSASRDRNSKMMTSLKDQEKISIRGQVRGVDSVRVGSVSVIAGKRGMLRAAFVKDEDFVAPSDLPHPEDVVSAVTKSKLKVDVVVVGQDFRRPQPLYENLSHEIDNVAGIELAGYEEWLKGLSQSTRRNVRLAERRGVEIRVSDYSEEFASGIKGVDDECSVRQGRPFWHYGKPLTAVFQENGTYRDSSDFIGAYYDGEMIGFIKVVNVGGLSRIMQILGMTTHFDKKPMFALVAKAVELACAREATHLTYCKYEYDGQPDSTIAEFKRRLSFEKYEYPLYVVPVNAKGRLGVRMGAHKGLGALLPQPVIDRARRLRERICRGRSSSRSSFCLADSLPKIAASICGCGLMLERLASSWQMECSIPPARSFNQFKMYFRCLD